MEDLKATEIHKNVGGRPKKFTSGKKRVPVEIPDSWINEKRETGETWTYILRKGLDYVQNYRDDLQKGYDSLKMENESINRRFNNLMMRYNELNFRIESLENKSK